VTVEHVLVTGAAGFIGSHLTNVLAKSGRQVIALDCFLPNLYENKIKYENWNSFNKDTVTRVKFDLRSDDFEMLSDFNISTIYNQAALAGQMDTWTNAKLYYECNLIALNRLLEFAKDRRVESFVQASTSSVYGTRAVGNEGQIPKPTSPYGISKLAAENLLLAYSHSYGVPVKILRYFSVYGPNQRPDMAYSKIISSIYSGEEFTIFGDGLQARTNTFISDVLDATVLASNLAQVGEPLNICGDDFVSLNEAIAMIESISGKKLKKRFVGSRLGDQYKTFGDNLLAKRTLNWTPKIKFSDGIRTQIQYYEDNYRQR
jgi:UDP-glucuronate 4-epimerase